MREDGFTVIEVLVAILLVGVGIGAVITAMTMPQKQTLTAQRAAQAGTIADRTLESVVRLRQTAAGWGTIAPTPATASLLVHQNDPNANNPSEPRAFITGSSLQIAKNYHDAAQGTVGTEALAPSTSAIPGGGTSTGVVPVMVQCPGGAGCASGDPPGKVYTFVTYRNESCSLQLPGNVLGPALNQIGTLLNTILGGVSGARREADELAARHRPLGHERQPVLPGAQRVEAGHGRRRPRQARHRRRAAQARLRVGDRPEIRTPASSRTACSGAAGW
jgi:prepilin-type N-terminal cleavage/methylation domain-containing protein